MNPCELVSDLMDGRLREPELSHALQCVLDDEGARQAWHSYHVVGDVLRRPDLVARGDDSAFLDRFRQRLLASAAPGSQSAPQSAAASAAGAMQQVPMPASAGAEAANDARFSWAWSAGFACLLVLGVAGWNALDATSDRTPGESLAGASMTPFGAVAVQTVAQEPVMIRDPRLDQLLAAHRQAGGISALHLPSGFLRNATFEVLGPVGPQR